MKHISAMRRAAIALLTHPEVAAFLPDILKGDAPASLPDEALERDPAPPPKTAPVSDVQALQKLKGTRFCQWLEKLIAWATKGREKAQSKIVSYKEEIESTALAQFDSLRQKEAAGQLAFIQAALLVVAIVGAFAGEIELIFCPLADMLGIEHPTFWEIFWLSAASGLILGVLSGIAHVVFDSTKSMATRIGFSVLLCLSSLLIGYVRIAQAPEVGRWVFYALWSWVSMGAPALVAWLFSMLWPKAEAYLLYRSGKTFYNRLIRFRNEQLSEEQNALTMAEAELAGHVEEYSAAYREVEFFGERYLELSRSTRRQIKALTSRHLIVFRFWRTLVFLVLGAALALVVFAVTGHAAEPDTTPSYTVVVCDRSTSGAEESCSKAGIMAMFNKWAVDASWSHRGRFDIMLIGNGIDVTVDYTEPAPEKFPSFAKRSRENWQTAAVKRLQDWQLPKKGTASAIIDAVSAASFRLSGLSGKRKIILMSDLREFSDRWDFERNVPTPKEFIQWLKTKSGQPELGGLELIVCGFHTSAPPGTRKPTADSLYNLRAVWRETFKFWGHSDTPLLEGCSLEP